jgi:hypothetical protein
MRPINLRSDTQTLPTPAMLEAIASAELGDDTYDGDPTVKRFEAMAAAAVRKPAAMLVISGHMANLIALMVHAQPGDEVILDAESHIFHYEVGSMASVAGLMPMPVASEAGMLDPERVAAAIREPDIHYPTPRLLCLENTHNRSGGRVIPLSLHDRLCELARARGLAVHLDGARIFNAATAAGVAVADYTAKVDSVMFAARCWPARPSSSRGPARCGGGSAAACGRRASSRPRASSRSRPWSIGWPRIMRAHARWPRGSRRSPASPSSSSASRPTWSTSITPAPARAPRSCSSCSSTAA